MRRLTPHDEAVRRIFADRLRELRKQPDGAYMQPAEAARRAGIDKSYWLRLESAQSDPSLTSMLRIQAAFDLDSIEALLGSTPSRELARTGPT